MNLVMKKSFLKPKSFFLFVIICSAIYWIYDVDLQIPGYESHQPLPEDTSLLIITFDELDRYLVTVDGVESRRNVCPLKIINKSFTVPLFSSANFGWSGFANFYAKVLKTAPGGEWIPEYCVPRFSVALIIALQDENRNLKDFLMHMHPFLQAQNIHYRIYIIEQTLKTQFNRGALLNVGFIEARKDASYPCFIFHDLDFLPKNRNNIYACTKVPRYLTAITDDDGPKLTDQKYFIGAVSFLSRHFELVNGFPNEFDKWASAGDEDFYLRILNAGLRPMQFDHNTSSYYLLPHKPPQSNAKTQKRKIGAKYFHRGLNTTNYTIVSYSNELLYTRIIVDL